MKKTLLKTDFKEIKFKGRGKVRDMYEFSDRLLIVSTDRISCFDVVLEDAIPGKGEVLNSMSCFWFDFLKQITPNHFITAESEKFPPELNKYRQELSGRSMLVEKARPLPVECIVRGYLSGSGWKEYKNSGSLCGIKLPAGLTESDRLPEVIFTPSTKAESGHDQNISLDYVKGLIGEEYSRKIRELSIALYRQASEYALSRGIIIADTKFEFGVFQDRLILIDEVLTPDSSRFWPKELYQPGRPQPSFDKQFVRDYLETLSWNKTPPAPRLPREIIEKTSAKYLEAYKKLTGKGL